VLEKCSFDETNVVTSVLAEINVRYFLFLDI